jgi:prenyltransferase beta subunit
LLHQKTLEERNDEVTEAYLDWIEECIDVQGAYESWIDAPATDAALAFAAYHAALDREERASMSLQVLAT